MVIHKPSSPVSTFPVKPPAHFCEDFCEVVAARFPAGRVPLPLTIVTATDAPYFVAAQLLYVSLAVSHVGFRFLWYDLGLTAKQRAWCEANGVELRQPVGAPIQNDVPGWQTWNKPCYLADAAAAYGGPLLWLDADTLVVGPLDWIAEALQHRPFVVHCFAATMNLGYTRGMRSLANRPKLYERFPVPRRMTLDRPNAGVFGCDVSRPKDRQLLDCWRFMVGEAARDEEIRRTVSWFDQGSLQWALEKCGLVNCVTHEKRFNDGQALSGKGMSPADFIDALENVQKQTRILHFPAGQKPYAKLPAWLPFGGFR